MLTVNVLEITRRKPTNLELTTSGIYGNCILVTVRGPRGGLKARFLVRCESLIEAATFVKKGIGLRG